MSEAAHSPIRPCLPSEQMKPSFITETLNLILISLTRKSAETSTFFPLSTEIRRHTTHCREDLSRWYLK